MQKYCGTVAILGKPNVGKSSLLNAIFGYKLAIVNQKPQTTRNKYRAIYSDNKYCIYFIDTPGFHKTKNKLDEFLNQEVVRSLRKANLIYFLFDPTRPLDDEDREIIGLINQADSNSLLVITKNDLINNNIAQFAVAEIKNLLNFRDFAFVSSQSKSQINELLQKSEPYLKLIEPDNEINEDSTQNDLFIIKEVIREQCLNLLSQEVPHGVAIVVDNYNYDQQKNLFSIDVSLIVEKDSHRKIIIGKGGNVIKQIGTMSRLELLKIFDAKIYLKIFVKVNKNWRNDPTKLKEFGYFSK